MALRLLCYLAFIVQGKAFLLYEPTFVSDWYDVIADNITLSQLIIPHNLGEYPVKVDIQVKINDGGEDYIFSGIGSSQRDDDYATDFGAVVYRYNKEIIQLGFPFNSNSNPCVRGLAYTDADGFNYKEVLHNLGRYPDVMTVRTLFSDGFISDGVGVVFAGNYSVGWASHGGLVYGYDDVKVRLWTPCYYFNTTNGYIFLAHDGYSLGARRVGTALILGWLTDTSQEVFYSKQVVTNNGTHQPIVNFNNILNLKNYVVSVQYRIPASDGPNAGMTFYASGTTQADPGFNYGGIIYVYTETKALFWRPKNKPVFYIGERWGCGAQEQSSLAVEVIVRIFSLSKNDCPYPENPANATVYFSGQRRGDTIAYTCNVGFTHMGGDLTRICDINRRWSGYPPNCVELPVIECSTMVPASTGCVVLHNHTLSPAEMEEILSEIKVSKKNTNSYMRTLNSAYDGRKSAQVIGMTGIVVLVSIFGFFIVQDCVSICMNGCNEKFFIYIVLFQLAQTVLLSSPICFIRFNITLFGDAFLLYEPTFVSEWYDAIADNVTLSQLIIPHNLGDYPIKVDIQVKIQDGGEDYIFSGIGSSQRDDDKPTDFGAVVYRYNKEIIQLGFPFNGNSIPCVRGLAYTGSGTLYDGPANPVGPFVYGQVRARAWMKEDMPNPVINMTTLIKNEDGFNYREVLHNLGRYPDIVTVRTLMADGYMSDGIGVVFAGNYSRSWHALGGLVYGYDNVKVRLWTPCYFFNSTSGFVFYARDGYSLGTSRDGTAFILGWLTDTSQEVFYSQQVVNNSGTHNPTVDFGKILNLTNYLVSVQYRIPQLDGPNGGMMFYAAGTTQAHPSSNYGGIIYVYTETRVQIWQPKNRPVFYIGERWGCGEANQSSMAVEVIVRGFHLRSNDCPYPENPANATLHFSGQRRGDNVTFACDVGFTHMGGDFTRTCGKNRRWSGYPPNCVELPKVEHTTMVPASTGCMILHNYTLSPAEMEIILKEIRVSKKQTNAYKRTLTSAYDGRKSAQYIGMTGIVVLVLVIGFFIFQDCLSICMNRCNVRRKT